MVQGASRDGPGGSLIHTALGVSKTRLFAFAASPRRGVPRENQRWGAVNRRYNCVTRGRVPLNRGDRLVGLKVRAEGG